VAHCNISGGARSTRVLGNGEFRSNLQR
jgi:hypothetical protein